MQNDAHKECGHSHGRFDAVDVSEDFVDGKMKSQAKKMKVEPKSVLSFFDVNDSGFEKQWLHVAAEDLSHDKRV